MIISEERIAFLMKQLKISRQEAIELERYDHDVDHNRTTKYDLSPEQVKTVQEMNRKKEHKKYGTVYKERKPNEVKEALIIALCDFLDSECEFSINDEIIYCDSVSITNKNRLIHFKVNDKDYDLQLIEKRIPKKSTDFE